MKRSLVTTLIIGVAVAGIVNVLHASGLIAHFELAVIGLISNYARATRIVSEKWQPGIVLPLSLGVAWLTLSSVPRRRVRLLVLFLLIELLGLSWVCSLYRIFFQPLPSIFVVDITWLVTEGWIVFLRQDRSDLSRTLFTDRLSNKELRRLLEGAISFDPQPRGHEVSVVVCDVANKHDLAEGSGPAVFAETTEKFIRDVADRLLEAGGYIQAADGEGVIAIFGFPDGNIEHANKAVQVALDLDRHYRERRQNNGEIPENCDTHVGVSSGTIIIAPLKNGERPALLATGEPIELARRFCAANRLYGSHILIGTRTFDLASNRIVARPIDFLMEMDSQERHEIYEPLWLASEAKPEHIARRDSFWNGIVLYREKRWAEAYTEFQKARGSDDEDDAPLQFYLRRLEPLALNLTEMSSD
ncbi:MAG TPA: adenylate/guanylate cyclase domain-containing protein [Candidatus Sulfotelmatobacter sp.]|nr:adenylate/guanylate cyclase domain-containing protein [Candidatus Sulfotelmatobacter sp.]